MLSIKFEAAAIQLEALGFIVTADTEGTEGKKALGLTDKGIQRAEKIMGGLPMDDRLLIALLCFDYIKDHPEVCLNPEDKQ